VGGSVADAGRMTEAPPARQSRFDLDVMAPLRRLAPTVGPAAGVLVVQLVLFPMPAGVFLRGVIIGGLTALVALGMALIYRSNRILNFAQADLGGPPAVIVFMLITASDGRGEGAHVRGTSSPSLARRSRSNSMISGEHAAAFNSCSRA
jgi:hypothetical protein